jgi:hypothetical protein
VLELRLSPRESRVAACALRSTRGVSPELRALSHRLEAGGVVGLAPREALSLVAVLARAEGKPAEHVRRRVEGALVEALERITLGPP